ncbi:MAG: DUF4956 domain-containing protein [Planctomycetota bacterium]|nr:DUF4956 domain-containing protein [Planctomycetota bacterium]MDP6761652.1 DUF4956 domain-containing protein [Planctomycetota bacterium]MDP6990163.1 DUF4956 domain-containing protein [Planctomycetota bacterium]
MQSLSDVLATDVPAISLPGFVLNLALAAALAALVGATYVRFGRSLSNRSSLARHFVTVGMTTMIIITIVKSSLALSLGLVGALSIVRFRTAIKEPEELAYLFLTIAIGLGFGADQRLITIVGVAGVLAVIAAFRGTANAPDPRSLHLTVSQATGERPSLERITELVREHSRGLNLMRFDDGPDALEVAYLVRFADHRELAAADAALRAESPGLTVSFVDTDGIR